MPLAPLAQKTTRARKDHNHDGHCHRQRAAPRPSCSPFPGLSSTLARARLRNTGCVSAARTPSSFAAPCTPPPGPCRPPIGCRSLHSGLSAASGAAARRCGSSPLVSCSCLFIETVQITPVHGRNGQGRTAGAAQPPRELPPTAHSSRST